MRRGRFVSDAVPMLWAGPSRPSSLTREKRPTHLDRDQAILRILPPALQQRLLADVFERIGKLLAEQLDDRIQSFGSRKVRRGELSVDRREGRVVGEES